MNIHGTILTEAEIIGLASKFLEPGFHEMPVASLAEGRGLITTFLKTLDYYKAPACVAQAKAPLNVIDLYELLLANSNSSVAELLCSQIHVDFLWVEVTAGLQGSAWYGSLINTLDELHFDRVMPIMILREEGA